MREIHRVLKFSDAAGHGRTRPRDLGLKPRQWILKLLAVWRLKLIPEGTGSRPKTSAEGTYLVSASTGDLAPDLYTGLVRFNTNAANDPLEVPVELEVLVAGPPEVSSLTVWSTAPRLIAQNPSRPGPLFRCSALN